MKMLAGFSGTVRSLTHVVISLLGLGIVVSLLGGNVPFVSGIADTVSYTHLTLPTNREV